MNNEFSYDIMKFMQILLFENQACVANIQKF